MSLDGWTSALIRWECLRMPSGSCGDLKMASCAVQVTMYNHQTLETVQVWSCRGLGRSVWLHSWFVWPFAPGPAWNQQFLVGT